MITERTIEIDAPAATVWDVYADVERWHEWTASVHGIQAVDGPGIDVGKRFRIRQPRFPPLVWTVTAVEGGTSWTWEQRSPGGATRADHVVEPLADGRTRVLQRLDQRGPIGVLVGRLTRGLTDRYLRLEAEGLRDRSEARHRATGAA